MRLKGRGIPGRGKAAAVNLMYELKGLAPTDLTAEERELMQKLADHRRARAVPDPRDELMKRVKWPAHHHYPRPRRQSQSHAGTAARALLPERHQRAAPRGLGAREFITPVTVGDSEGNAEPLYDREALRRARVIRTLEEELDVNLPGIGVILDARADHPLIATRRATREPENKANPGSFCHSERSEATVLEIKHAGLPTGSTGGGMADRIPPVDLWATR